MRAVLLREFGPPSVLVATEVPEPRAGPGQVIIDVAFANVTFVETQVRAGRPPNPAMLPGLPAVLGNGVGGVISAVSEPHQQALIGLRVVASLGGTGGYAELAVADVTAIVEIPPQLTIGDAVAVLADGRTALLLMRAAAVQPGETVLVEAAAGGVGTLLVQLARNAGAQVVGAAGGARKLAIVRDLGADVVVDYADVAWPAEVKSAIHSVDVVFDGVGGTVGRAAFDLLQPGGRFVAFGMASGAFTHIPEAEAAARSVTIVGLGRPTPDELRELVSAALSEAADRRLRPHIGQTFALEQAAEAHAAIEQRATVGKTLLLVAGEPPDQVT
jgi:NADPH2:quinone reductase